MRDNLVVELVSIIREQSSKTVNNKFNTVVPADQFTLPRVRQGACMERKY